MNLGGGVVRVVTIGVLAWQLGGWGRVVGDTTDEVQELRRENQALKERLDRMERQLEEIQHSIIPPPPSQAVPPPFTPEQEERLRELTDPKKRPATAGIDVRLYGYVKLDAAYDSARTSVGNFARWVESVPGNESDDQFSMTANQTRVGLDVVAPRFHGIDGSAKVEVDFYGGGTENKANLMMRLAYLKAVVPDYHFELLAGQAWDVISPLVMPTINYSVGWWQGNIGYRRPQIRLTEVVPLATNVHLKLEAAASRTISGRFGAISSVPVETGTDAGYPTGQGRVALTFPFLRKAPTTIGFSGHYGWEEYDLNVGDQHRDFPTWSVNTDLTVPITSWLKLQGEAFTGKNLNAYLGAIDQGYDPVRQAVVRAYGGWLALTVNPNPKWEFNVGAGFDNPNDSDLSAGTARTYNQVVYGNGTYYFTPQLSFGYELSYLTTNYKGLPDVNSIRNQIAFIFKW